MDLTAIELDELRKLIKDSDESTAINICWKFLFDKDRNTFWKVDDAKTLFKKINQQNPS